MTLTLRIDNFNHLPDGGPIEYSANQSGFELGRDPAMDWTLPDPNRFVSSCHAEVRYENGGYWLYDVSTNGTFVNGGTMRVKSPYQLQHGDKLQIGHYLVVANVDQATAAAAPPVSPAMPASAPAFGAPPPAAPGPAPQSNDDIWSVGSAAPPASGDFVDRTPGDNLTDFGDQHLDLPSFSSSDTGTPPPPAGGASPFGAPAAQPAPAPQQPPAAASDSPFGAPEPQVAPPAPSTPPASESPFGAPEPQAAPPAPSTPPASESPFGAPEPQPAPPLPTTEPPAQEGSPFGAPQPAPPPPPAAPAQPAVAAPPVPPPPQPSPVSPTAPAAEAFSAPPAPAPSAPPPPKGTVGDASGLLAAIADGAGINPKCFEGPDPGAVAHEIGKAMRIMVGELAGLLKARAATKQSLKSGSRTMIGADANNPLKFMPGAEDQLEVMFGTGRQGYMRGAETVQKSFNDIKMHQYAVHAALQPALARLLEDMAPEAVEEKVDAGRFSSKHARAWEIYVERWDAKTHPYDNGMLDVFLAYFSEAYDDVMEQSQNQ
ncbi:type VI secretion system-associated FHA domain protein TagH [Vannielia sp.]|uniref:type VI secretion system-associated FHA domain protein TagH n=1 Tax=Vannielia sp. TaxID=2813045 RepID=UPI0026394CD5|nr:type VI secretion system-associated FHA domain protein TagH [Vannielia sp.]MDF1872443.1 type VI secretion system-associated FHA domain protein TagH [Vannielia sp.]